MKIKELKQKLDDLGFNVIDIQNDYLQLCFNVGSRLENSLIGIIFYKKNDNIFMTDDYFFVDIWAGDDDIVNYEPIKKVKKFASKYNIDFDYKLEKKLDIEGDLKRQIEDFFKVEMYADIVLSECKNK